MFDKAGVLLCLLPSLVAQERDPLLRPRADSVAVLGLDGPAALRSKFLATNLGTMLEAKEAGDFWTAVRAPLRAQLRALGESAGIGLSRLLEPLEGYRGRITAAVDLRPHPQAWAGIAPDLSVHLVLAPDGETDLGELAREAEKSVRASRLEVRDIEVGGRTVPTIALGAERGVTMPVVVDGHLVALYSERIEEALGRQLAEAPAFAPDAEFARAPLALRVSLPPLVEMLDDDAALTMTSIEWAEVFEQLGLNSLREFRVLVRPAGPHVQIESSIRFDEKGRGVFDGWFPDVQSPPALAALVPPDARYWQAGKWRPGLIYEALKRTTAVAIDEEKLDEDLRREFGIDLGPDLFAHAGEECVWIGSIFRGEAPRDEQETAPGDRPGSIVLVQQLSDPAAFRKGWAAMNDEFEMFTGEPTERIAGVDVFTDRSWVWGETSYALDGDLLFFATGDDGFEWLAAVLRQRELVLREGGALDALPKDYARLARSAPPGFQGCSGFDMSRLLAEPMFLFFDDDDLAGRAHAAWTEMFARLAPLMHQHEVERAVAFTGYAHDTWRYRVFW